MIRLRSKWSFGALLIFIDEKVASDPSLMSAIVFQRLQGEAVDWVTEAFQDEFLTIRHYCVHRSPPLRPARLGLVQFPQIQDSANSDDLYDRSRVVHQSVAKGETKTREERCTERRA
ncbi:uncharacterized protein ARMOST_11893 [Armillaria ostoyae]|uniref:Uncharacterized protein n=1 Tax=Armillaria ostoyae TaxID=47428 RepID=A0A284RIE8_ARMOS|nr:uncharacterized protein ARMOST_11893 [Armillaria ostoyae]